MGLGPGLVDEDKARRIKPALMRDPAQASSRHVGQSGSVANRFFLKLMPASRVYGHHHPDYLRTAAQAIGHRPRQSLVEYRRPVPSQPIENLGGPGRTRTSNQTVMSDTPSPDDPTKSDT